MSFIKILKTSTSALFLLILSHSPAFTLTVEQKVFVHKLDNCLETIYKRIKKDRHIDRKIIIAMAIVESSWGNSRFAKQGNNLFGIRTYNLKTPHIKPSGYKNPKFGLKKFNSFCDSVAYTIWTLNDHHAHKKFSKNKKIDNLTNWAADPDYIKKIKEKMKLLD